MDQFIHVIALINRELILFSAVGFLIGGIDELIIDLIWIARNLWRRLFVYPSHSRATSSTILPARQPGCLAIFVPAWDEADVIAQMLSAATNRYGDANYMIFVGCYRNDPASIIAIESVAHTKITLVFCDRDGPTTKADCLNNLWRKLMQET